MLHVEWISLESYQFIDFQLKSDLYFDVLNFEFGKFTQPSYFIW